MLRNKNLGEWRRRSIWCWHNWLGHVEYLVGAPASGGAYPSSRFSQCEWLYTGLCRGWSHKRAGRTSNGAGAHIIMIISFHIFRIRPLHQNTTEHTPEMLLSPKKSWEWPEASDINYFYPGKCVLKDARGPRSRSYAAEERSIHGNKHKRSLLGILTYFMRLY